MPRRLAILTLSAAVLYIFACDGPRVFENELGVRVATVNDIRDSDLSASEKRARLREYGIDDLTINAILRGERTGNQYGGTRVSAVTKVREGRLDEMTPDEIQIYSDAVDDLNGSDEITFVLSDEEALAVADLFGDNSLQSRTELADFLDDPGNSVSPTIPEDFLQTAFVDTDPGNVPF
jgi:hypothetical protein